MKGDAWHCVCSDVQSRCCTDTSPTFWALPPALGGESGVALDPVHHASPWFTMLHHGSPWFTMVHPGNCALDKSGPMKRAIDSKHSKVNGPIFLRMPPKSPNILNESHVFRGGRCAPRGHFCVKRDESRLGTETYRTILCISVFREVSFHFKSCPRGAEAQIGKKAPKRDIAWQVIP